MKEVVVVEAVRTPIGKRGGALSQIEPIRLGARTNRSCAAGAGQGCPPAPQPAPMLPHGERLYVNFPREHVFEVN